MRETLRSSKEYGRERMYIYGRYHDWVGEGFPCVSAGTDSQVSRLLEDWRLRSRLYSDRVAALGDQGLELLVVVEQAGQSADQVDVVSPLLGHH